MVNYVEARAGRAGALFLAPQAAYGTAVDNFAAATARRVWSGSVDVSPALETLSPPNEAMVVDRGPASAAAHDTRRGPAGAIAAQATFQSVEYLLRSNWGAFAGGLFTLAPQINERFTVGWAENVAGVGTSAQRFARVRDAWFHRVTLDVDSRGEATLLGEYAGEARLNAALNALGPVTLPSAPMAPTDQNVFAGRSATLRRDPSGTNDEVTFERLRVIFEQKLEARWTKSNGWRVTKSGRASVSLGWSARAANLGWAILDDVNSQTRRRYRLTLTAPNPTRAWTIDLFDVGFDPIVVGHDGQDYRTASLLGYAHVSGAGSFVTISLV